MSSNDTNYSIFVEEQLNIIDKIISEPIKKLYIMFDTKYKVTILSLAILLYLDKCKNIETRNEINKRKDRLIKLVELYYKTEEYQKDHLLLILTHFIMKEIEIYNTLHLPKFYNPINEIKRIATKILSERNRLESKIYALISPTTSTFISDYREISDVITNKKISALTKTIMLLLALTNLRLKIQELKNDKINALKYYWIISEYQNIKKIITNTYTYLAKDCFENSFLRYFMDEVRDLKNKMSSEVYGKIFENIIGDILVKFHARALNKVQMSLEKEPIVPGTDKKFDWQIKIKFSKEKEHTRRIYIECKLITDNKKRYYDHKDDFQDFLTKSQKTNQYWKKYENNVNEIVEVQCIFLTNRPLSDELKALYNSTKIYAKKISYTQLHELDKIIYISKELRQKLRDSIIEVVKNNINFFEIFQSDLKYKLLEK